MSAAGMQDNLRQTSVLAGGDSVCEESFQQRGQSAVHLHGSLYAGNWSFRLCDQEEEEEETGARVALHSQ